MAMPSALRTADGSGRLHRSGGSGGSGLAAFGTSVGVSPSDGALLGAAAEASSAPASPRHEGGAGPAGGGHVSWADEVTDVQMAGLLESSLLDVRRVLASPAVLQRLHAPHAQASQRCRPDASFLHRCTASAQRAPAAVSTALHGRCQASVPFCTVPCLSELYLAASAVLSRPGAGPRCPGPATPRAAAYHHGRHSGGHTGCAHSRRQQRLCKLGRGGPAGGGAGPARQQVGRPGAALWGFLASRHDARQGVAAGCLVLPQDTEYVATEYLGRKYSKVRSSTVP